MFTKLENQERVINKLELLATEAYYNGNEEACERYHKEADECRESISRAYELAQYYLKTV